jgi:hypothetical protein
MPSTPASGPPVPGRGVTVIDIRCTGPNQVTPSCTGWNASSKVVGAATSGATITQVKRPTAPGPWFE